MTPPIPVELEAGHVYVLRDWAGPGKNEQWYKFSIDRTLNIEINLSKLYLGTAASLETEDGTIVAVTVPEGSPFGPWVASQVFKGPLPAGTFYLRVVFAGTGNPGTSFQLALTAQ